MMMMTMMMIVVKHNDNYNALVMDTDNDEC